MHYKNGTPANNGDSVIYTQSYPDKVIAGVIHSLDPKSTCCNGIIAHPTMGGCISSSVVVGECYRADEAFGAIESKKVVPGAANPPKSTPAS